MIKQLKDDHPYWEIRKIFEDNPRIKNINASFYKYRPQSLVDERVHFELTRSQILNPKQIAEKINSCDPDWEMAIHSKIIMDNDSIMHIPMIDMSTGSAAQLEKLRPILEDSFHVFSWYKSGRSYHGYAHLLINTREWTILMGKLLLANQIGFPATVDPRWIGHRLVSGYAALRWTKNTNHYLDVPQKINKTKFNISI